MLDEDSEPSEALPFQMVSGESYGRRVQEWAEEEEVSQSAPRVERPKLWRPTLSVACWVNVDA